MQSITTLNAGHSHALLGIADEVNKAERLFSCTHEMFEAQVNRTPDAIAVVFNDEKLTYQQLNGRANQLAHRLVKLGVGPESLVGICIERSPEMVIAVLAVLKAGGAYVPMDPTYPAERIAFMLSDAHAAVLLTQSHLIERLDYHGPSLCLDTARESIQEESPENVAAKVGAANLAYVIYTSGSTGKPKGAMIQHRGLSNYLSWCTEAYAVAEGCGAPLHSSVSFDLTVTSLFSPLLAGRSIFLLPDGMEALAAALLERDNYSLVKITPAHLRALAELIPPAEIAGRVRALIIGGEALHFESLAYWRENAPATRIINEYGPTETVVGCCVYEVAPEDPSSGPVPIGRPIANTELLVLNHDLETVATGETAELFIGGDGVARGYLNREKLTQARFISDSRHPCRLYRSGDLCRMRPDGNLEYIGRVDDQVKIRGFRIELGEIESTLKQCAGIADCAAVVCEESSGEKRLAAFYVSDRTALPNVDDLKATLRTNLPDYMIPGAFVEIDALPLTINGKVDRQALSTLSIGGPSDFVAARTPVEKTLANIWAEVLNVKSVSINDNFFDLGGDSILGTLILARAARAGVKLSPMQLFKYQTIAELALVAGVVLQSASI